MRRFENWPSLLCAYLDSFSSSRFEWGTNDCCTFSNGAIKTITGIDALTVAGIRKWSSMDEARSVLASVSDNFLDAVSFVAEKNWFEEIQVSFARRGDLIVTETDDGIFDGLAAAIIGMNGEVVAATRNGLIHLPVYFAIKAWRI